MMNVRDKLFALYLWTFHMEHMEIKPTKPHTQLPVPTPYYPVSILITPSPNPLLPTQPP